MNFAVLQFPGTNRESDAVHILQNVLGHSARLVWHKESSLGNVDGVIVPGGFSYGDYLRTGAVARWSLHFGGGPVSIERVASSGGGDPPLGIGRA